MARISLGGFWVQEAENRLLVIERRLPLVGADNRSELTELLAATKQLIADRPRALTLRSVTEWWTGTRIERVWSQLHQCETELLAVAPPQLLDVLLEEAVEAASYLPSDDPARQRLSDFVKNLKVPLSQMNA
jgi:hypothetical protein